MQLGTFGAILSFAIELEEQAETFYEKAASAVPDRIYSKLARSARKRAKRLERTRREGVAEMILESITGLDGNDYRFEYSSSTDATELKAQALALESNAQRFYMDAETKLPIKEVARSLNRLAEENVRNQIELEQMEI
jgi:rubrerythrin